MIKTYYVTKISGSVRRLDDFTLPWVDVSTGSDAGYNDIMAFPNDPEKVIVVGKKSEIQVSTDSGATWNIPGGNYQSFGGSENEFYEVWVVNQNVSYAVANNGVVVKSIDGGLNYNGTTSFPTFSGTQDGDFKVQAVHFIDENIGVVGVSTSGGGVLVWKTIDGGNSWIVQNNGTKTSPKGIAIGIHLSADENTIVAGSSYFTTRSIDGGATFTTVLDLTTIILTGSGKHLTWISDTELWLSGSYDQLWKSVDAGATWNVIRPYDGGEIPTIAAHFYNSNDGFIGGSEIYTTDNEGLDKTSSESFNRPFSIWTEFGGFSPCYVLTDCAGEAEPIYTAVDLLDHVGQVVTLADEEGSQLEGCWLISENTEPCLDPTEVSIYRCYTQCSDCLPAEPPIRVPKPRAVLPNYTTGNCDPAIIEKAFCNHAELLYRKHLAVRYKIKDCCPKDETKIEMTYHKMAYQLLKKPNPTPDPCNPICMEYEAFIQPGYSAVTTYFDCGEKEQVLNTDISTEVQIISVCSLNVNPPTVVVSDDQDEVFGTYVLLPIGKCAT